jgi:hypothetical protein
MSDEPENLVLVYLRRIDGKLERLGEDMADVKRRLTSLETQVALLHGDFAGLSVRLDRLESRIDRIERRIDIVPVSPE